MHTEATLETMKRYRIGKVLREWENMKPPIQGGVYHRLGKEEADALPNNASIVAGDDEQVSDVMFGAALETSSTNSFVKQSAYRGPIRRKDYTLGHSDSTLDSVHKVLDVDGVHPWAEYVANAIQEDINFDITRYPSLDPSTQRNIAVKFQNLHQRVKDGGFYQCRFIEYGKEMVRYTALFALFIFTLNNGWYMLSACFLGLFWHQIMFTAHDAGHRGITRNITTDTLIGIFIADFCCGLSIGWWKSSHNVHHLVTNAPVSTPCHLFISTFHSQLTSIAQEHDPDIQNIPLFATSPAFLETMTSSYYDDFKFIWDGVAVVAVTVQRYTYYPVMALARFNLYILSWGHLLSPRSRNNGKMWWARPTEIAGISCYLFLFFYVLLYCNVPTWTSRAIFVLTSHLITMPLHVQITLSHWGTSTADLGPVESFAQRQLRTTMDVSCPQWLDFIHGGLQFQAVHHLFPRVPRHNRRKLQGLVQEFCADTEIEYLIHDFVAGNGVVLTRLQQVAEQAKILAACQRHMSVTGESGLY